MKRPDDSNQILFAINYMKRHFGGADYTKRLDGTYKETYELTDQLLAKYPQSVKNLRADKRQVARIAREAALDAGRDDIKRILEHSGQEWAAVGTEVRIGNRP